MVEVINIVLGEKNLNMKKSYNFCIFLSEIKGICLLYKIRKVE